MSWFKEKLKFNEVQFMKDINEEFKKVYHTVRNDIQNTLEVHGGATGFRVNDGQKISFKTNQVKHLLDITFSKNVLKISFAIPNNIIKLANGSGNVVLEGKRIVTDHSLESESIGFPYIEILNLKDYKMKKENVLHSALQTFQYQNGN